MHRTLHKSEATALRRKKSGGPRGGATPLEKRYFIILESIELDLLPPSSTSLHYLEFSSAIRGDLLIFPPGTAGEPELCQCQGRFPD